jgi:predicted porin
MKKTLIALAAVAVSGAAFAQATIKGTFDPSYVMQTVTSGAGVETKTNGLQNNRQGTSQVTFFGSEDLGGGLKANFLIENDFNSSAAVGATNLMGGAGGELYAGISGGFGSLKLGAPNTPTLSAQAGSNPFGTKLGSGFAAMNTGKVRNSGTVRYDSPAMSGSSVAVAFTPSTATAGSITDIGVSFSTGALSVGASSYTAAGVGAAADNTLTNLAVNYDFGAAKVGVGYFTEKNGAAASATAEIWSGATNSEAYNVSITVPMGAVTLMANYAVKDDKAVANNDRTVTAVGARYTLSKRTSVYGRFVTDRIDNALAAATAAKASYTIVGLQHNF